MQRTRWRAEREKSGVAWDKEYCSEDDSEPHGSGGAFVYRLGVVELNPEDESLDAIPPFTLPFLLLAYLHSAHLLAWLY
ncbi:MAG: hypothetical protein D6820_05475 [Lentisphaerae bacterium]|nr:MAG: hypothetical protein D6820_05475 [Lentisphaerota bacterium]